jgi:ABC-type Fe3+ transport system substrate-binding protein
MSRLLIVLVLASLAGCGPSTPAATPPSPTASATLRTAGGEWEVAWSALIEAARQEGKVVVSGPPTPETRVKLPARFKERFGIETEYLAQASTSELLLRMDSERSSGLFTVDAMVAGAQSMYTTAYPNRYLDPIRPILIHPEATDGGRWVTGAVWFMDPEQQYLPRLSNTVTGRTAVNTDHVDPVEIRTFQDLLDPKYQGKISVYDPTRAGSGWNTANYLWSVLGEDYLRRLYVDQKPGVSADFRQLADWLARGTYPISVGLRDAEIQQLQTDGFRVVVTQPPADVPRPVAGGFGGVLGLVNRAPHPNAARLFVNWMLMREGQEVLNSSERTASVRTDVDSSRWLQEDQIPQPGEQWFDTYGWEFTLAGFNPQRLAELKRIIATP